MTKHKGSKIHRQQQIQSVRQAVHIHLDTRKKQRRRKKARAFRPVAAPPPVMRVVNNHIVLPENAGRPAVGFFEQQAVKQQEKAQSNLVKQIKTELGEPEKKDLAETKKVAEISNDVADDAVKGLEGVFDKSPRTPEQLAKAKSLYPNRRSFPKDYDKMEKLIASAPAQPAVPRSQRPTASSTSRTQVDEYKEPSLFSKVTKQY